ncbi:MAG: MBL fold metallo-hydrolase, partial [Planctomycetaceae bacterium]|nr:MBL fold metallo-hydrolase [Planctomycetaceae bacterium]
NAEGPPTSGLPVVPALPPEKFQQAVNSGDAQLVDTRQMLGFGGGHIPDAISIGSRPEISVWAGQILDHDRPLLLVLEDEAELESLVWQLVYTGFTCFAGYLVGGMKSWENAGYALQSLPQVSVHELQDQLDDVYLLDVRAPDEWEQGHIPGAHHLYLADMRDGLNGLSDQREGGPVVTYCDSGYRASIAASLLQQRGFTNVRNVPGSWQAWSKSGYPVEK